MYKENRQWEQAKNRNAAGIIQQFKLSAHIRSRKTHI
jgi:hypothetical protein